MTPPSPRPAAAVDRPESGGVSEIAPGVLWVRLALPFALDHINVWLLEDGPGYTLVDTGLGVDRTREVWERLAATVLAARPIRRVVCTHYHPDHVGLAGELTRRYGAELWCSQAEWTHARMYALEPQAETDAAAERFYRTAGMPEDTIRTTIEGVFPYRAGVADVPASYRRLRAGDEVTIGADRWQVLVGRGHAPEHVCLHAPGRRLLISGDQVLPSITPNVSVMPSEPMAEPLSEFLDSLAALRHVPDDVLVLPSHGRPFTGLHRRIHELTVHHRDRLDEVLAACRQPRTAWEVMRTMFRRPLDPHQTTFAVGESVAHLNHLVHAGHLARHEVPGGADRFARVR
jgi:glyoxylase-like metal-dependent hydrolase (beta-lactamase superfamily II)